MALPRDPFQVAPTPGNKSPVEDVATAIYDGTQNTPGLGQMVLGLLRDADKIMTA